jgi:hypothetical protein
MTNLVASQHAALALNHTQVSTLSSRPDATVIKSEDTVFKKVMKAISECSFGGRKRSLEVVVHPILCCGPCRQGASRRAERPP